MFLLLQKYSLYIPCVLIGPQSLVSCISVKHRTEPRRLHIPAQIINSSALTGFPLNCRLCRKPKKLHLTVSLPLWLTTKCINQAEKASVFAALASRYFGAPPCVTTILVLSTKTSFYIMWLSNEAEISRIICVIFKNKHTSPCDLRIICVWSSSSKPTPSLWHVQWREQCEEIN